MRILHVTHHYGCKIAIDYVMSQLGYYIETQYADWNYNLSKKLAFELWNKYKDYYMSFDVIITSDTASLSRIFLQNNYPKKLIIWVCNRFDYSDYSTNDVGFPDDEFYELFKSAKNRLNVEIRSYTKFEHEYAKKYRNIEWSTDVLKPCNFLSNTEFINSAFPKEINKSDLFLITSYHNDNILLDLKSICDKLNIKTYRGRYNGPLDLIGIKGIIHIPYAWSNLALFENWSIGNVYFIPSIDFLFELSKSSKFFWSPPYDKELIKSSEWYLSEHEDLFIYFNSFEELGELVNNKELIDSKKSKVLEFSKEHTKKTIKQWENLLKDSIKDV